MSVPGLIAEWDDKSQWSVVVYRCSKCDGVRLNARSRSGINSQDKIMLHYEDGTWEGHLDGEQYRLHKKDSRLFDGTNGVIQDGDGKCIKFCVTGNPEVMAPSAKRARGEENVDTRWVRVHALLACE